MFYKDSFRKLHAFGCCVYIKQICCVTRGLDATIQSAKLLKLLLVLLNSVVNSYEGKKEKSISVWLCPVGLGSLAARRDFSTELMHSLVVPSLSYSSFPGAGNCICPC